MSYFPDAFKEIHDDSYRRPIITVLSQKKKLPLGSFLFIVISLSLQ